MPFNNPPTGGTSVFSESWHSALHKRQTKSESFVHQNTVSLKMWGWKKRKKNTQKMLFFQENWQTKEILHRFCNNRACLLRHFFSTYIVQVKQIKKNYFFLDLSWYRIDLFLVHMLYHLSQQYLKSGFWRWCLVWFCLQYGAFYPLSTYWVVAATGSVHGGVWFSTEHWVWKLLFVAGCSHWLPSLHLSRIWTFALVLFSFIFIWCQVKTKTVLSKRDFIQQDYCKGRVYCSWCYLWP